MQGQKKNLVIAIDGPSGAGKSTVARLLAQRLGYTYIDTGAMYRAIGWKAKRDGIDPADEQGLSGLCTRTEVTIRTDRNDPRIIVDAIDVTGEIRTPEMGMMASAVSKSACRQGAAAGAAAGTRQSRRGRDGWPGHRHGRFSRRLT